MFIMCTFNLCDVQLFVYDFTYNYFSEVIKLKWYYTSSHLQYNIIYTVY